MNQRGDKTQFEGDLLKDIVHVTAWWFVLRSFAWR